MKLLNIMALDAMLSRSSEETHYIRKSVLEHRLVARKKSSSTKKRCPFDALHLIDEGHFEHHLLNCVSNTNVKAEPSDLKLKYELGTVPLEEVTALPVSVMEDWQEENLGTYDPWRSTEKRDIIRCLYGGTKSQRKLYKLCERKRLENLEVLGIIKSNLTNNFKHTKLRRPLTYPQFLLKLKRLALDDFDTLLKSADVSKLLISDVNNTINIKKPISEIGEEISTT
ncbi:uncharacterized protein LOC100875080 [Megachile rotundata]|uniref:uncharacterized protein LOC100875080 n=1 Tax=Megachile rotundata TaxID=143995 RepID=UPI003FD38FCD